MGRARSVARRALRPVLVRVEAVAARRAEQSIATLEERVRRLEQTAGFAPWVPPVDRLEVEHDAPFMAWSTCSTADFAHPRFAEIATALGIRPHLHRKLWEYVFVVHHLTERGMLGPGSTGLGFGVGTEPLTAAFAAAGARVVATDAPAEIGHGAGWVQTAEHSTTADDLPNPGLCDPEAFREAVTFRTVDMNAIDDDLTGFDFCWSACCFEHLGSIRHGLDFVVASVERCLRPGGVAVHTTELNLSSDDETFETPNLSIYRHRDLAALADELRGRGHDVAPITIAPDSHRLDGVVDLPPYHSEPHLKIELAGYVTTSVGLVITRGD